MMDDRVKCLVYQYLFRCLHDADVDLQKLDERLRSHSFPVAPSDYSDYACALARKMVTEEIMSGVFSVLSMNFPKE